MTGLFFLICADRGHHDGRLAARSARAIPVLRPPLHCLQFMCRLPSFHAATEAHHHILAANSFLGEAAEMTAVSMRVMSLKDELDESVRVEQCAPNWRRRIASTPSFRNDSASGSVRRELLSRSSARWATPVSSEHRSKTTAPPSRSAA